MKAAVKVGGVLVVAVGLLLSAAVANLGANGDAGAGAVASPPPASSAFLQPAVGGGSLESSIARLQDRLRAIPSDWRGFASLGLAYVAEARATADPSYYPKAQGVLEESLRLQPDGNVVGLLGLGALELARHDFAGALVHGREAEAVDPYNSNVYGVKGDALLELGRYRKAFRTFQTMLDTRPDLAGYARASYARELTGDVPGAIRAMRLAFVAAGSPADMAWAAYQLGELEFGRGEVAAAAAWYRRGLGLAPNYVPNLAGMAKLAWARGDVRLAIRRYSEAVAAYPSIEYVTALGDLYAVMGRADLAEQQYAVVEATRALAQANGVNTDLELALFDADHGKPRSALAAARAEWGRRHSIHVADAYAWALYANGRYDQAAAMMRRALVLGTRNATFFFHAGVIERARGRDAAARRYLRHALATNPNFSILYAATAPRVLAELEAER